MSIRVIECTDKALLKAFTAGLNFLDNHRVEHGQNGRFYRLIIKDSQPIDNATYRLTRQGLHFSQTGVEL